MSVIGQAVFITLVKAEIQIQTHSYILIFIVAVVQEQKSDAVPLSRSPNLLSAKQLFYFVLCIASSVLMHSEENKKKSSLISLDRSHSFTVKSKIVSVQKISQQYTVHSVSL